MEKFLYVLLVFLLFSGEVHAPLEEYTPAIKGQDPSRDDLITSYFLQGFTYLEICNFLLFCHGILISLRQLKRLIKKLNLKKKQIAESPLEDICSAILQETNCSGRCLGYKSMWKRLQKTYKLQVKRETVWRILKLVDAEGVQARRQKRFLRRQYVVPGPNFVWHLDGYDKLKPFGFAIHGAIDGFSRRILWLRVATSNNDPRIIAYYFLQTILKLRKGPTLVRTDKGTENVTTGLLQNAFRYLYKNLSPGCNAFIQGKSTSNQRIECWWSQLRRLGGHWWISYFKDLRDRGLFNNADLLQVECLRFCYGHLLQYELENIAQEWNQHKIRKQKNAELYCGKPDVLYFMSESVSCKDYGKCVQSSDINVCLDLYSVKPEVHSTLFAELVELVKPGTTYPVNVNEAFHLYSTLLEIFKDYDN